MTVLICFIFFFFKQKTAYEMRISDWSSDVCSSDLILAPDNGHHELLPNAVRVLELNAFAAQQWLQVVVGIALALATVLVFARGIRGIADSRAKAAALLALVLGVSWLGNIRALAHGNESVHAYWVTLFLAIGLHALSKARTGRGGIVDAALAAACGLAAAFSFGSGIACFVAFAALLLLRRAPRRARQIGRAHV